MRSADIFLPCARRVRQFRLAAAQGGLREAFYWAAFGWLRVNRLIGLALELDEEITVPARPGVGLELASPAGLRAWRQRRPGLPTELFQDLIDGVESCAVVTVHGLVAGVIWVYGHEQPSRLFRLGPAEAELNYGYILPEYRRLGLFRDLLSFACSQLRERGIRTVFAMVHSQNRPSMRAFTSVGFRVVGSAVHFLFFRPKLPGRANVVRKASPRV